MLEIEGEKKKGVLWIKISCVEKKGGYTYECGRVSPVGMGERSGFL